MTSKVDAFKTNEFLRRRKLRLQQVREQSKDIARKIRQRAKVVNSQHLDSIDARREKEYFDCQEKLVKHLELLYSKGLQNVGASHRDALEATDQDCVLKTDISKLRGKEAAEVLRKEKQDKLDLQKKVLDRKLQARQAANELSREKSAGVTKNLTKQTDKKCENIPIKPAASDTANQVRDTLRKDNLDVTKNDMGTQWESEELPNEWEPNVPILSLPNDDSVKESQIPTEKTDKSRRLNLFALSDEMPSSLRGGLTGVTEDGPNPTKPSLTLVSEYLQSRNLKLRQHEPSLSKKDDLQIIKQTILRTRAARTDGNVFDDVCHVLDKQVIPVPSWHAEESVADFYQPRYYSNCLYKTLLKTPVNKFSSSPVTFNRNLLSNAALKEQTFYTKTNALYGTCRHTGNKDKMSSSAEPNTGLNRKKSVTVYNHNTKSIQDIPCSDDRMVSHDNKTLEDAYANALRETAIANSIEKEQSSKIQRDIRTKIAVTKNNVDKEYKDTLAFLNSLAKEKNEQPIKTAYMDEHQQRLQNEKHQRKLQEEFKKIEKECNKHNCKHSKRKATILENRRNKSRSPIQKEMGHNFEYSWMPVPESDGNLVVHTIPNINPKTKSGNSVKFSQPDSYHEYRSRHKHTPPTKDVSIDRQSKKVVETVIVQETNDSDINRSSDTSSVENLNLDKDKSKEDDSRLKDAERIIIYKILESKKNKKSKESRKDKTSTKFLNSSTTTEAKKLINEGVENEQDKTKNKEKSDCDIQRGVSFEKLQEGVYEAVNRDGDNISSMYFHGGPNENNVANLNQQCKTIMSCCCSKSKDLKVGADNTRLFQTTSSCRCSSNKNIKNSNPVQASDATSSTSFTTAFNEKTNNRIPDGGFIKLIDDEGQESNKFYVGASGFLKDDNYEVVIQLRKKETEKAISNKDKHQPSPRTIPANSLDVIQEIESNIPDNASPNSTENEPLRSPVKISTNVEQNKSDRNIHHENAKTIRQEEIPDEQAQSKKLCEKAVYTSFEEEFAIPASVPKSDPISRPGTSTYTQTSFNLSMPRPAFMHMSSSTSTAYMSPPELILPKFLKQNYVISREELYESENTINQLDSNFEILESEYCNEFDCRCKVKHKYQMKTPPNTVRSGSKESYSKASECENIKKKKTKCHKCRSRSDTNLCPKIRLKKPSSKVKSSRELLSDDTNSKLKQSAKKKPLSACSSKENNKLNSVVKDYVNKLLALNSEGLKAIEIINQDCSTVTTPGSSIINLPCNKDKNKSSLHSKISLEQIKNILKQQILKENLIEDGNNGNSKEHENKSKISMPTIMQNNCKVPKKKSLHKVKSLNISRHILKKRKPSDSSGPNKCSRKPKTSVPSSVREEIKLSRTDTYKDGNKNFTMPRKYAYSEYKNSTSSDIAETSNSKSCNRFGNKSKEVISNKHCKSTMDVKQQQKNNFKLMLHRAPGTSYSSDSDANGAIFKYLHPSQPPAHTSTQTNGIIDTEIHFMKIAEDKLQNMEKIADLTEKCTKRLSNLAKVLEEVRKNKSLVYSQISSSESAPESETKADKNEISIESSDHIITDPKEENVNNLTSLNKMDKVNSQSVRAMESKEYTPLLKDIPKPAKFAAPSNSNLNVPDNNVKGHLEFDNTKIRGKPPPALSRIHLKCGEEINIIPHELSTVVEVDSPMSMRVKSQSSRQETKVEAHEKSDQIIDEIDKDITSVQEFSKESLVNLDLLKTNLNLSRRQPKVSSTDSSDDSKMRMMDMKKFNDIMLKPFISLKDYAKQCNIGLDEGLNHEEVIKDDPVNDDLSSLNSDGSLPDVIAELLKRNVISEPFKFDTGSNANSTTVSSESTMSVLALSKARKERKKSAVFLKNKENIAESSATLSISSNPDLENAFQKLGMGWASSTLKKTKERLALSSSSNTSSSSMTQFKIRSFSHDIPNLASDSTSSLLEVSNKRDKKSASPKRYKKEESSRNAIQQTSLSNSMTVKEFLTNELAKKITFNNSKSTRKGEEDFVSLYETKMPDEMKHTKLVVDEEQLSVASVNHNRARTSTPVQIFKSQTYHSTSTSNTSNGFFSNADDLSSVKVTSASIRNHSTSDKDDLTIPNYSLKTKKGQSESGCSKSD